MNDLKLKDVLVKHYNYLNGENAFVEFTDSYICVNWHCYMDKYINMKRIKQICIFIKKHLGKNDNRPVMDANCRVY